MKLEQQGQAFDITTEDGQTMHLVRRAGMRSKEFEAIARLFVAAPELLEACEEAFDYLQNMPGPADRLRAAIAKAKG